MLRGDTVVSYRPFLCVTAPYASFTTPRHNRPVEQSNFAICLSTFCCVYICVCLWAGITMESVKSDPNQFDISKICRTCLREKGEMRSVFLAEESIGQAMILAEMIMGFTSVQVIFLFVSRRARMNYWW